MMLKTKSLFEPGDLSTEEIERLFQVADDIRQNPARYQNACAGKLMATLFYEPSTRTRLSFTAAMERLGGRVMGFSSPGSSSVSKGETVLDTTRILGGYVDLIVMRHFVEGAPKVAALYSPVPVINAGDGGHNHPTQTLTDLYTLHVELGRTSHLKVAVCGDLKYGRTVHSLIQAMSRYEEVEFTLISPKELQVPEYLRAFMRQKGMKFTEIESLEEGMKNADMLYMTRIQRERFASAEEYERLKDSYVLDGEKMRAAKPDMVVLHPLPRVNEIAREVDDDPRAAYFRQARNGMFIRMALILGLLEHDYEEQHTHLHPTAHACQNPRCIANVEGEPQQMLPQGGGEYRCLYCDYTRHFEE